MHLRTRAIILDIECWVLKKYIFNTLVTPMLLNGVKVWCGSIPKSTWKEFENVQIHFLTKFLQAKKQTPYTLLLETGSLHMERVVGYILKVHKSPSHQLPRTTWKANKKIQKRIKEIFCVLVECKILKNSLFCIMLHTLWRLTLHTLCYTCCT